MWGPRAGSGVGLAAPAPSCRGRQSWQRRFGVPVPHGPSRVLAAACGSVGTMRGGWPRGCRGGCPPRVVYCMATCGHPPSTPWCFPGGRGGGSRTGRRVPAGSRRRAARAALPRRRRCRSAVVALAAAGRRWPAAGARVLTPPLVRAGYWPHCVAGAERRWPRGGGGGGGGDAGRCVSDPALSAAPSRMCRRVRGRGPLSMTAPSLGACRWVATHCAGGFDRCRCPRCRPRRGAHDIVFGRLHSCRGTYTWTPRPAGLSREPCDSKGTLTVGTLQGSLTACPVLSRWVPWPSRWFSPLRPRRYCLAEACPPFAGSAHSARAAARRVVCCGHSGAST